MKNVGLFTDEIFQKPEAFQNSFRFVRFIWNVSEFAIESREEKSITSERVEVIIFQNLHPNIDKRKYSFERQLNE